MSNTNDPIEDALQPLRDRQWTPDDNAAHHERHLLKALNTTSRIHRPAWRNPLVLIAAVLILAGGAVAAGRLIVHRMYHVNITTADGEEVVSDARILVEEGQTATMTIGSTGPDGEADYVSVEIDEEGEVQVKSNKEVEVDVDVETIDPPTDEPK